MTLSKTKTWFGIAAGAIALASVGLVTMTKSSAARPLPRLAEPQPAADAEEPRLDGGKPDRDRRWGERMTKVNERAAAELGVNRVTAELLLKGQSDLRAYKHQVRRDVHEGLITRDEGNQRIARRHHKFKADVHRLLGEEKGEKYFVIVKEVRMADNAAPTQ